MNIQENIRTNFTRDGTEGIKPNVLLLGGGGFIGGGLRRELVNRGHFVKTLDRADIDLSDASNIAKLADLMVGHDCIFMLASYIGADLFKSSLAIESGIANRKIYENTMAAIDRISAKNIRLFYYSTSEIYWNMTSPYMYIDDNIMPGVDIDYANPRSIYAAGKLYAERNLFDRTHFFNTNEFSAVNIIRPFNVYGLGQKRGVMYSMLKSGITGNVICYSDDTTRTLTALSYISEKTADLIPETGFRKVNMSDGISTYMETLAIAVQKYLAWKYGSKYNKIQLKRLPPDDSIRYRQASAVNDDPYAVFKALEMSSDMDELSDEIMKDVSNE